MKMKKSDLSWKSCWNWMMSWMKKKNLSWKMRRKN
jgi:hypothetical protein